MMRHQQMKAQRARAGGQGTSRDTAFPLPVGGLFVVAKNAEISGTFAAELNNWRSTGFSLELRPQAEYPSGPSNILQRIPFEFGGTSRYIEITAGRATAGSEELFRVFNGAASVGYISGQALIADGLGAVVRYDGSSFTEAAFTTADDSDPETFDGVLAHHDRPYFWKRGGDLTFYYGDVGAVQGELTAFPLGRLGNVTGSVSDILSLTVDAGHGMNDTLCILTTTGQMVLYEGLDPGDPADWRLVTRVQAAPPVTGRPFAQVGSDLWMITASGVVSVTQSIRQGVLALVSDISRPVADAILKQTALGGEWQLQTAANGSQVTINHVLDGVARQWVYHVESKTWATSDYPARRWHNLGTQTQFTGTDGSLGQLDRASAGQEEITATWISSWFRIPRSAGLTHITPTILARAPLTLRVAVLTDHDTTAVDLDEAWQTITQNPDNPGDGTEVISLNERIGMDAVGSVFQIRMEVTAKWAELVQMQVGIQ